MNGKRALLWAFILTFGGLAFLYLISLITVAPV